MSKHELPKSIRELTGLVRHIDDRLELVEQFTNRLRDQSGANAFFDHWWAGATTRLGRKPDPDLTAGPVGPTTSGETNARAMTPQEAFREFLCQMRESRLDAVGQRERLIDDLGTLAGVVSELQTPPAALFSRILKEYREGE